MDQYNTSKYHRLIEICDTVIKAMEKTKVPAKDMPELANALYLLRAVVKSQRLERRSPKGRLTVVPENDIGH